MVFIADDIQLVKSLRQLKGYSSRKFLQKLPHRNWTRRRLNRLLAKIDINKGWQNEFQAVGVRTLHARLITSPRESAVGEWRQHLHAFISSMWTLSPALSLITHGSSSSSPSSLSPLASSLTRSVFHSELKTWLFSKSFPP